jgi:hypothetical protein
MATFVKGDFVQVTPNVDWKWDQWKIDHTNLCNKTCKVVDTNYEKWTDQLFIEVEHRGKRLWFLDRHLIKVDNYEEVFQESIHRACEELQRHEEICKKLRDEILDGVFGTDTAKEKTKKEEEELYDDWHEVTTKEVIPLPGNGGTMTTSPDPKASADTNRKKIRKIKKIGKKMSSKKTNSTGSLSSTWTLSEEELQELQDYIDELPYVSQSDSSGDIDYGYDYDNWDGDGNAD